MRTACCLMLLAATALSGPPAAATTGTTLPGALEVRITLEVEGRSFPLQGAGVTLMRQAPDTAVIRRQAARAAETGRTPFAADAENARQYQRFQALVAAVERRRPGGRRRLADGVFAGRTDHRGELVMENLPPGRYYLAAYRQALAGFGAAWLLPVSIGPDGYVRVTLSRDNAFAFYLRR